MKQARCRLCGGTGYLWLMRSWFLADGLTRTECPICSGDGQTEDNDCLDAHSVAWQARLRAFPKATGEAGRPS